MFDLVGHLNENTEILTQKQFCLEHSLDNNFICDNRIHEEFVLFVQHVLQKHLLHMASILSEVIFYL